MIRDQLDGNQPPIIDTFDPDPSEGEAPLVTSFAWSIIDLEGNALTCTLDFGNKTSLEVKNCGQVTNAFHEYVTPGGYVAVLNVTDGATSVSRSAGVRVTSARDNNP